MYADLAGLNIASGTIPPNVQPTTQRPDLVIVWPTVKEIAIIELTIPFEMNVDQAHERKNKRYESLVRDIENNGFKVHFYAIEIGCRGHITKNNVKRIKDIFRLCKISVSNVLSTLSRLTIISSFTIFYSRHERQWVNPELLDI